ncbi:MAG TPA: hypothetical protein IGS52_03235 [Oscillatoriaceae cyanobacterium M33_DOE_052]|nr:hypothetical protein [Oscillatoriaceae cyanobacterium M33_DOE_052]
MLRMWGGGDSLATGCVGGVGGRGLGGLGLWFWLELPQRSGAGEDGGRRMEL